MDPVFLHTPAGILSRYSEGVILPEGKWRLWRNQAAEVVDEADLPAAAREQLERYRRLGASL